jgi:epoxyqueuosine reductase QueG
MITRCNTRGWIEETVSRLVLEAPENRLVDYGGQPIFDLPLVGIANGDDPLFEVFSEVVSPRHLLPRDILRRNSPRGADLTQVSVVAWVLPFTTKIRHSNRVQSWPSRLYSMARNNGGALNYKIRHRLTQILRRSGSAAVAPTLTEEYDAFRTPEHMFGSSWSERHIAYAAGLGRFGLNGSLVTPKGTSVRLGSIVTNLSVERTQRGNSDYRAPCLETGGQECRVCIDRCPVGAISRDGLDKAKCYAMRKRIRERYLEQYVRGTHMLTSPIVKSGRRTYGYSLGCALCQCGVPCESSNPWAKV